MRPLPLLLLLLPGLAAAGPRTPCDGCEACTTALATPGAEVELTADLTATGAACVVVRGAGATFNSQGHSITGGSVGLRVEAPDVLLRRPILRGGRLEVAAARTTLLAADLQGADVGLLADGAPALRVVRSTIQAKAVGIALGRPTGGTCPGTGDRSPGAVLRRVTVRGATVGVAACEGQPLIMDSTLTGNGLGLLLGAGLAAPTDPCVCAPGLEGVSPGTTLFFSSGCGGCQVHEGFLPDVLAQGQDVLLRKTGPESKDATAAFDAVIRRCAPEITDAIGIPGCVPNYACLASGEVAKRREGDRLAVDHSLASAADVAAFAAQCRAAADARFAPTCPATPLIGNTVCGNRVDVVAGAALPGAQNACGTVQGAGPGCDTPCPAAPIPADVPAAPTTAAIGDTPPATAGEVPRPGLPPWLVFVAGALVVGILGLGWARRQRSRG
ncbi:MAG: hypothetical protein H6706_20255 [Myxococcales bacterium]|nr:hypothetical protein [Myxococcales bacterium]